jgi:hypothetical protein
VPLAALAAPVLCAVLDAHQAQWLGDYRIGLELLLINAALTAAGLWLASLGRPRQAFDDQAQAPSARATR